MKLLHISDLHFGKTLHECPLVEEDQPHWKEKFLELVDEIKPDAVLIAGDVYDRSTPSNEAVKLLDEFLTELSAKDIAVLMVSGNHDSGQKLSFGSEIFEKQNVYISGVLRKNLKSVTINDEYGPVTFWLMPYVFPALIASVLEKEKMSDYDTAVRELLSAQNIDFSQRNVLIAHQNVVSEGREAQRGGSETMIGGVGAIDYKAFDGFTYVALGHIHAAQYVGRKEVRYAGSPLCYHFSETRQSKKGPLLVEIGDKNDEVKISTCLIEPIHQLREIVGKFDDVINSELKSEKRNEYIRVVLTDSNLKTDSAEKLRAVFESHGSKMLEIVNEPDFSEKTYTQRENHGVKKNVGELFRDFFFERSGEKTLDNKENAIVEYLTNEVSEHIGEEKCGDPDEKDVDKFLEFIFDGEEY